MLLSTEKIKDLGFGEFLFKEQDLRLIFDKSPASRYGLVNKAIKKNEWVHLSRGAYVLAPKYRSSTFSQFYIASSLVTNSYVSLESALSFHQWIPERVVTITSVISKGRSHSLETPLGEFKYLHIPINEYEFLSGVNREGIHGKPFLMASPLRALADYIYEKKIKWSGLQFLLESLRIENESLETLTSNDFDILMSVYRSKRVLLFLEKLRKELRE